MPSVLTQPGHARTPDGRRARRRWLHVIAAAVGGSVAMVLTLGLVAADLFATSDEAEAEPAAPGTPVPGKVLWHEDFQKAPATGLRTMITDYDMGVPTTSLVPDCKLAECGDKPQPFL